MTALARYTIRAAAVRRRSPAAILRWLNDAMLRQELDGRFCTIAVRAPRRSRARRSRLTVACGGHPPPLLRARGRRGRGARRAGTLLGLVDDPQLARRRAELRPATRSLLYTDGITEARAPRARVDARGAREALARAPPARPRSRSSSSSRRRARQGGRRRRATTSPCSRCGLALSAQPPAAFGLPVAVPSSLSGARSSAPLADGSCSGSRRACRRPRSGGLLRVAGRLPVPPAGYPDSALARTFGPSPRSGARARGSRPPRPCGRPSSCAGQLVLRLALALLLAALRRSEASSVRSPAAFLTRPLILSVMPMVGCLRVAQGAPASPTRRGSAAKRRLSRRARRPCAAARARAGSAARRASGRRRRARRSRPA